MGIKSGNGSRRHRGRSHNRRSGGGSGVNQLFDSSGPEARVKGTAPQVQEKYESLARDSSAAGDRIAAENFLQHAEHYLRLYTVLMENQANISNGSSPKNNINNTKNDESFDKKTKNGLSEEKIPSLENTLDSAKKDTLETGKTSKNE